MGFEGINDTITISGSSSEENDHHHHHEGEKLNESEAVGGCGSRFYECMYCKRGFTNAQALGGHMNIHRKEKAKVKLQKGALKQTTSMVLSKSCEDLASCSSISTTTTQRYYDHQQQHQQQTQYYEVPVRGPMSYRHFFPGSNPSYDDDFVASRKENMIGLFQEHEDLNHGKIGNDSWKESGHEVDLELRLGLAL